MGVAWLELHLQALCTWMTQPSVLSALALHTTYTSTSANMSGLTQEQLVVVKSAIHFLSGLPSSRPSMQAGLHKYDFLSGYGGYI